jgi:DNA-binding transcriptional ArsR family regulator
MGMTNKTHTRKVKSREKEADKTTELSPHNEGFHGTNTSVNQSIDETKRYHTLYLRAINSPIRRKILQVLKDGEATIEKLESSTQLNSNTLEWHLSVLAQGFCVEKKLQHGKPVFCLTQEGKVVDYLE